MHPLLERQEELHTEAHELLQNLIVPIISGYGEVAVGGSYAYRLLTHPDIDIDIVTENCTKEMYAELCKHIISQVSVSKFKTTDRVAYPHTHTNTRPTGYWLSPEVHFGKNIWTLDIWLQNPEWYTGDTSRFEKQLTQLDDEKRLVILSLKDDLRNKGMYGIGKEFQSVDVYNAVLNSEVKTIEDLRRYTQK